MEKTVLELYKEIVEELVTLYKVEDKILIQHAALEILKLQVSANTIQNW